VLLASTATAAFGGIVFAAWQRPSELATYSGVVAGIATLALALMTVDAVRAQVGALAEVRAEREPKVTPYVEWGDLDPTSGAREQLWAGVANVGGSLARDVRVDLLSAVPWLKTSAGQPLTEATTLGVGGRLRIVVVMPTMGDSQERYPAASIRVHWWTPAGDHRQIDATLDLWPHMTVHVA
jgi:hypothetical protein